MTAAAEGGPGDQAGREVQPPAHPPGVSPHRPPHRIFQSERPFQLRRPSFRLATVESGEAPDEDEVVMAGQVFIKPGVLPREADQLPHPAALGDDVEPEDPD